MHEQDWVSWSSAATIIAHVDRNSDRSANIRITIDAGGINDEKSLTVGYRRVKEINSRSRKNRFMIEMLQVERSTLESMLMAEGKPYLDFDTASRFIHESLCEDSFRIGSDFNASTHRRKPVALWLFRNPITASIRHRSAEDLGDRQ